jgi:hypothetical protein
MSEVAQNVQPIKAKTHNLHPGSAFIAGRIYSFRRLKTSNGSLYLTVLKVAAPDPFSHPSTIELRSAKQLGAIDEDWSGLVKLSGFPRNFDSKPDPETGEVKHIKSAENHLVVVED